MKNSKNYGSITNNCHVANMCENDDQTIPPIEDTTCAVTESNCPLKCEKGAESEEEVHDVNTRGMDAEVVEEDLGNLFLLLALCFHTVFEGLAFGLLRTRRDVWSLFIAVAIHKSLISFSLGTRVASSVKSFRACALAMLVFAAMCPLGGAIGLAISEGNMDELTSLTVNVVLQAIATGTFIQVVFFEILRQELSHNCNMLKVGVTLIGFLVMAVVTKFLPA